MRTWIAAIVLMSAGASWAADLTIKDAATLALNGKVYRLDGIDAPELDQTCLDDKGATWAVRDRRARSTERVHQQAGSAM